MASRSAPDGDADINLASVDVFNTYCCSTVTRGKPHPGDIAEPASLSAVPLPPTSYPLWDTLPEDAINGGLLSQLQLEGVLHACAKHQEFLPSGERCGFMIGDGAGVGKGRQIAAIIIDNYARGRRRHVWLSISTDLHLDTTRDFRDLGCHIHVINNCQSLDKEQRALGMSKDFKEGCLFMTYSTLIAGSTKASNGNGNGSSSSTSSNSGSRDKRQSRVQQVVEWLGGESFDGCLVFDECHKAKNFGKDGSGTKVAATVIELQRLLPKARVLYCSATGVSEVANMAYMSRMGLWGSGTAFSDFDSFLETMKRRGVSFLEMLAMELKMEGKYVARGLSFKATEFTELSVQLTDTQTEMYNRATDVWLAVRRAMETALPMSGTTSGVVWRSFWSAQQRFFKLLCVSLKVPTIVQETKQALNNGCCVVIGLQTTGESAATSVGTEVGPVNSFVSPTRETLRQFILTNFPIKKEIKSDEKGWEVAEGEVSAADLEVAKELSSMREELLARVDKLKLPPNFLDELIDEFGGPDNVAEMTGRKSRTVRDSRGYLRHEMRAKPDTSEMDSLNVKEREKFQQGIRLIAIISDAASTGISLHASLTVPNRRRRVHLTIELPWSADKAIQQLGRTHRSNQACGPLYKLISTNVGGEKRFAAAVARRLQSLGALTRGDRRAASAVDLSAQNFDTQLGRKSLKRMYDCVVLESPNLPPGVSLKDIYADHEDAQLFERSDDKHEQALAIVQLHQRLRSHCDTMFGGAVAVGASGGEGGGAGGTGGGISGPFKPDTVVTEDKAAGGDRGDGKDVGDVKRFLNRLLALHVEDQNLLFAYFFATLAAETKSAKSEGKLSEGLSDLRGRSVTLKASSVLWDDKAAGLTTTRYDFDIDRGVSFQEAVVMLSQESMPGDESGFMRSKRAIFGQRLCLLAIAKPGARGVFTVTKPNTGSSYFEMDRDELFSRYERQAADDAELAAEWDGMYARSLESCMHGPNCQSGPSCPVGRRITQATILSGSVVRLWGVLEQVLLRHELKLSKADRTMRVVRVEADASSSHKGDGMEGGSTGGSTSRHVVGVRYPASLLPEVVVLLCTERLANNAAVQNLQGRLAADDIRQLYHSGLLQRAAQNTMRAKEARNTAEAPTPVDPKSLAKAFRAPKTMLDFFRPKSSAVAEEVAEGSCPPAAAPSRQQISGKDAPKSQAPKAAPQIHALKSKPPANPFFQARPKPTTTTAPKPSISEVVLLDLDEEGGEVVRMEDSDVAVQVGGEVSLLGGVGVKPEPEITTGVKDSAQLSADSGLGLASPEEQVGMMAGQGMMCSAGEEDGVPDCSIEEDDTTAMDSAELSNKRQKIACLPDRGQDQEPATAYVPNPRPKPVSMVPGKHQVVRPNQQQACPSSTQPKRGILSTSSAPPTSKVQQLMAMGFSRELAEKNLWLCHGNVQKAAALCLPTSP